MIIRNNSAQTLIESSAVLVLLTMLFLATFWFVYNINYFAIYKQKTIFAISQSLKHNVNNNLFLGYSRPGYPAAYQSQIKTDIANEINILLTKSGLKSASSISTTSSKISNTQELYTVKTVINNISVGENSFIPNIFNVDCTLSLPTSSSMAPSVLNLTVQGKSYYLPVYGTSSSFNLPSSGNWMYLQANIP